MYVDLLQTIAEVAATLAGFSGVVFILGHRAERSLTEKEKTGLFHLLLTALGALVLALGLAAALTATGANPATWRVGCGLIGIYNVLGASRAAVQEVRGQHSLPYALAWPLPTGGILLGVACMLVAAGFFGGLAPVASITGLIWLLLVSVFYFVSLLIPRENAA